MKAWIPLTLVFALGSAAHSQATCTYPSAPEAPPDGATATKEQMIAAKHNFDHYNSEMNAYLDCIKLEMDNAAVDELQANVGRFNEQLKIYKAKNK